MDYEQKRLKELTKMYEQASSKKDLNSLYEIGLALFKKEAFDQAYLCLKEAAGSEHIGAVLQLVIMHTWGCGCEIDIEEAERLIKLASEHWHQEATEIVERLQTIDEQSSLDPRHKRIAKTLMMIPREQGGFWPWLDQGTEPTKKDANKFFLCSILDYQMKVERVIENTRRFSEETLGDPENLWEEIVKFTEPEWKNKKKEFNLHWLSDAHDRVWRIANDLVEKHNSEARNVWKGKKPAEVLEILLNLVGGEQIPRMIVGALIDTGLIEGSGDVKADIHVKKVLGRALKGEGFKSGEGNELIEATRAMYPPNPWLLDQPLFSIGMEICDKSSPNCKDCCLRKDCAYYTQN